MHDDKDPDTPATTNDGVNLNNTNPDALLAALQRVLASQPAPGADDDTSPLTVTAHAVMTGTHASTPTGPVEATSATIHVTLADGSTRTYPLTNRQGYWVATN